MNRLQARVIAALSLLLIAAGLALAKPGTPKGTQGAYELTFNVDFTGTGNAAVAAKSVTIVGHITNTKTGAEGTLNASHLALDDGHFAGTGRFNGETVTLNGRVEAADGKFILVSRVFCNFSVPSGSYGRALGERKGG